MRHKLAIVLLALASVSPARSRDVQFTPAERDRILAYWSDPSRYITHLPPEAKSKGIWQVRLSSAGSIWLWNYNRARKVSAPPTMNAAPAPDEPKEWEAWLKDKIARDRWEALQVARRANLEILGKELPDDRTVPAAEPPRPGPMPEGMLALAGNPPAIAQAVVPMQHEVRFDDVTLTYSDNIKLSNPRYAYYRFPQGVNSEGKSVRELPAERLGHLFRLAGVTDSEAKVMSAVSTLEGGFDAINTYDTGFVTVGFIQFACLKEGAGALGAFLKEYKLASPESFERDLRQYGVDVSPENLLVVLDPTTGAEVVGPAAVQRIIEDKRLIAVFQHAGQRSDDFCAAQIRSAKAQFLPGLDPVSVDTEDGTMTGRISDFIQSEAGLATLMDRKVNTGRMDPLMAVASRVARERGVKTLADLAPFERDIVAALKYRKDFLADGSLTQPPVTEAPKARLQNTADRGGGTRGHRKKAVRKTVATPPETKQPALAVP